MDNLYLRGLAGQYWYNFTETLVYGLTYKPTPENLTYHKNIKYGDDKLQYVNIYTHKDNIKRPVMIYIHGGSWVSGITEMRNSYISNWAIAGFNTVSLSYSYAPQKTFPSQIKEMFKAFDFICENAEKYNLDTENILLAGESAGGYFISYAAAASGNKKILEELDIYPKYFDKMKFKALLSISGCYDLKRLSDKSKPQSGFPDLKTMITSYTGMNYPDAVNLLNTEKGKIYSPQVNSHYPPSFIIWADKDLLRFESFDFSEQLRNNNVDFHLYKADGLIGMHAWAIVMLFKKSKKCLQNSFDYILPKFNKYFTKENKNWIFK